MKLINPEQYKTLEEFIAAYEARNADILARYLKGESPMEIAARYHLVSASVKGILRKMGQRFARVEGMSDEEKRRRNRVRSATIALIKKGEIVKQACEVCGYERAECHHERYDEENPGKWIRWLCQRHHVERHNELGWRRVSPINSTGKTTP